jgi:hypothetical protein
MKDKINLEITNTNNRISTNKTKLELSRMKVKKNQLIHLNNLKQHKTVIKKKNNIEEKKINSEFILDSEKYDLKTVTDNNDFIRNRKQGIIRKNNNSYINFEKSKINIPFSGIKHIDNLIHKAEHDIKIKWRTIGNNTISTGPIVWDSNNNITYSISNIDDGVKKGVKNIPSIGTYINLNVKKNEKSAIIINNEKYNEYWVNWKDNNLEFWGSPLQENRDSRHLRFTDYYNNTKNIVSIILKKKSVLNYNIWKWINTIKKINVSTNNYIITLKPNEHFAIQYDGMIELNIQIDNVSFIPNKEHISKWYEVDIPKNHYFSFNTHKDLGYQFQINFNEQIYNANIFLNDYQNTHEKQLLLLKKAEQDSISSKKIFDESKQLVESIEYENNILQEKNIVLKLYNRIFKEYNYIKNKINLLIKEVNIEKAEDYISYLNTSQVIFKEAYNEYIPKEFERSNILLEDIENINDYRFEIQEMYYKSDELMSNVKNISIDLKKSLLPNWKKEITNNYEIILNNRNLISLECQQVENLKKKIYSETEWRDNIANTFKYYKKCVQYFDVIKDKYDNINYYKNYLRDNNVFDTFISNKINDSDILYQESKNRIDNLYVDFKVFQKTADEIRDEEIAKIDVHFKIIQDSVKNIENNVEDLIKQHNQTTNINESNIIDISNTLDILKLEEKNIEQISNKNDITENDKLNSNNKKIFIQTKILEINNKLTKNVNENNTYLNLLTNVKNVYTNNKDIIDNENNKIIAINDSNTNLEIKTYYTNKKSEIDTLINKTSTLLTQINNLESKYTKPLIEKNENETESQFQQALNIGKSSNAYDNIIHSKFILNQIKIQDNKCQEFSINTIDYINDSGVNFFEKIQQVENNINSLNIDCNKSELLLNESKALIAKSQNETTCIIDDINKIKYLLNKINAANTNIENIENEIKLTRKLSKQISALKKGLDDQKKELEKIGKTNIPKKSITFQVDEIVVKGTDKTMFRDRNPRMINNQIIPSKTRNIKHSLVKTYYRTIDTNILYKPPATGYDNYVMRYIYWGEATMLPNKDHAPTNPTMQNNDNDIGILSIRYSLLNNTPFINFYNTFDTAPYDENQPINKGYFFKGDQQEGVWNFQNQIVDPSFGLITSLDWFKIQKFNSVTLYKDISGVGQHNMGFFVVYENNDNKTNRPGNNLNKTTRFSENEYGMRGSNLLGNQGPRQLALRNHAALLGWLGPLEKKRMETFIDDRIKSSENQFIKGISDFNYDNGLGMFVMLNVNNEFNDALWKDNSDNLLAINGRSFLSDHNGLIFFTVQNLPNGNIVDRKLIAYKDLTSDLSFNTKNIVSKKLYEFNYKGYHTLPLDPDPEKRPEGQYIYNNYEYYKQSGPDDIGKYTMIERNRTTGVEITRILSPYIYEKNRAYKIPYNETDSLSNIYRYTQDTALITKLYKKDDIRISISGDPSKNKIFNNDTFILEIRKLDSHTLDIDDTNNGLLERYLYVPFTGFNSNNNDGKYHKINDWDLLGISNDEYIHINNSKQTNLPINNIDIEILINKNKSITERKISSIKLEKLLITQKQNETKFRTGEYFIQNMGFDKTITGNDDNIMKLVVEKDKLKLFKIINGDYDVGNLSLTYTYINRVNYWKYYKTNLSTFDLFSSTNGKPYNVKVHKIRIETNEIFPLEICNIDVFTSLNYDVNDDPIKPLIKYSPPDSSDSYKFKNPRQSSTSDMEYTAIKAVNGITDFDNYSQTGIDFTNKLKWFEVELDPPSRITSISFQARKNQKYNDRINNAKIFLIDDNGQKINWKWRQIPNIPNSENYETDFDISSSQGIWVEGKSAIIKGTTDDTYTERVSKFSRIKTIQNFEYYPQDYFVKNDNQNLVHRYGYKDQIKEFTNSDVLDWNPIFDSKQAIKTERIENYNEGLVPQGFYIMSNSNWEYNWVVNKSFGLEFKKIQNKDVLEIYSLQNDYEKKEKKLTYYYDVRDKAYNLNGDVESDIFFWKHSKIKEQTYKLYENRLEILSSRKSDQTKFISNNRIIEGIEIYKQKIIELRNQNIELRKSKRIKDGNYIVESNKYSKFVNAVVNHPNIDLFYLNSDFEISIDTQIKKIILEGNFNNVSKKDITLVNHSEQIIKQELYSVFGEKEELQIHLEKKMDIQKIKLNDKYKNVYSTAKLTLFNVFNQKIPFNDSNKKIPNTLNVWGKNDTIELFPITFTKKIKKVEIELIRSDFTFDNITLYDIDKYIIPNNRYKTVKNNNFVTIILNNQQELTKITTQRNDLTDISGSKVHFYSIHEQKLSLKGMKYFTMNSDISQNINISIEIPVYKNSLEKFIWNEVDDNEPHINNLRYISIKDSNISYKSFSHPKINYINKKVNTLITLKEYDLERKRLSDIKNLENKEFRSKLPGDNLTEFFIFPEDKISNDYNTHSKNAFKIVKDSDKLFTVKLNDKLEEIKINDSRYYKTYIWNKNNLKYENEKDKKEYITELHDPYDYTKDTWIIINVINDNNIDKITRMNIQYFPFALKLYNEGQENKSILDLQKKEETEINPHQYLLKNATMTTSKMAYLDAINKDVIRLYNSNISKRDKEYKTLNKLSILPLPYSEFHIKKITDGSYKYISFNTTTKTYNNKVFIYKKSTKIKGFIGPAWTREELEPPEGEKNMGSWISAVYTEEQQTRLQIDELGNRLNKIKDEILILNDNDVITELTISDWDTEKILIDEKNNLEYQALLKAQEEIRIKKLEKQILDLNIELLHNIGGDLLKTKENTKYWDYLFNNVSELQNFDKMLPDTLSNISYEKLVEIQKISVQINSKKKDGAFFYVSRGIELWKRNDKQGRFRFTSNDQTEIKNVVLDIDSTNFLMTESNSLHLKNYKDKLNTLGKKEEIKDLTVYNLCIKIINKAIKIRYLIEYMSNERLIKLLVDRDNNILIDDDYRPNKAHDNELIKIKTNEYVSILDNFEKEITYDVKLLQRIFSQEELNNKYKEHMDNYGTSELLSDIKNYMNKINQVNKLINFSKLFNSYGPNNKYWNYKLFNSDYKKLPRSINKFINISHLGPYPNEFIMGVSESEILEFSFVPNNNYEFLYDDPFNKSDNEKVDEILKITNIDKEYQKKLKDYYDIVYNVRRWQTTISNKKLLQTLSPIDKIWTSLNDVKNDINELNIKDITIFTKFNLRNIDITLKNNSFREHSIFYGTNELREQIDLYYNNVNVIMNKLIEIQKNTPILEDRYLAISDENIKYEFIAEKNGMIKIKNVDEKLVIDNDSQIILNRNEKQNNYVNDKGNFISVLSFKDNVYKIKIDNTEFTLIKWPTFYSFGDRILQIPPKNTTENTNFILGMDSKNYSSFNWWINQQNRNMDATLGTRLNSEKSVAKEAIKMPFLIYLRNNILLPMRGFNERIIENKKVYISWSNKGIFSFTKNELLNKSEQMKWWLNEWTKPLHYDLNENIIKENKLKDGTNIPNSKRWPNVFNTVNIFDSFISNDSIIQWATFLKNTGWSSEIKKNITHKIIETALFPIIERVTRHTKELIDLCIYILDINEHRNNYISVADDYIKLNSDITSDADKNVIKQKYFNKDINVELNEKKQLYLDGLNEFQFVKLYKSIKKRLFNENDSIDINKNGKIVKENIIQHMSKVVHNEQVFSEWKHYQEFGWRSYGHGSCGEWFNGAYDHPNNEQRANIKFNLKLREFFVNTQRTFVTLKSLTDVNYEFDNHIRLINESYSGNYWFNDYKKIVELVIKEQFLSINSITEYEEEIKRINIIINNNVDREKESVNKYIRDNYDFVNDTVVNYKKYNVHDFSFNNVQDYYNGKKIIVNFLSVPNSMVILLKDNFNHIYNTSYIAIYDKNVSDSDIVNKIVKPVNKSKKIIGYKSTVTYDNSIIKDITEYKIPFSDFHMFKINTLEGTEKIFKLAIILKKDDSDNEIVFAIANNVEPFKISNNRFNIKNSYISWLNYKEKLQLLIPEANNTIKFIKNIKQTTNLKDVTFFDKKIKEFEKLSNLDIPKNINEAQNIYEVLYNRYTTINSNDIYTISEWNKLLKTLYGENSLVDEVNVVISETEKIFSGWNDIIEKYNLNYNNYSSSYNKVKPYLDNAKKVNGHYLYLNKLVTNTTLSNINDHLNNINLESNLYKDFLQIINELNNLYENVFDFQEKNTNYNSIINKNIDIINKYIGLLKNGIKNPYSLEKSYPSDFIDYFYKNKWEDEINRFDKENYIKKFTDYIKSINKQLEQVTNINKLINSEFDIIVELKQKTKYQISDLNLFKQMIIDMDLLLMDIKNKERPIVNSIDGLRKEFISLEKEYNRISNKTKDFVQNDMNSLTELIIIFNPNLNNIKENVSNYDKFKIKCNKEIEKNIIYNDIDIDTLKTDIDNININLLNSRIEYKKYINRKIIYNTTFKINNTNKVIINIKDEINKIENKFPTFLNESEQIKIKIEKYTDSLITNLNTIFSDNKNKEKELNDKTTVSKNLYTYVTNQILYKIPTGKYILLNSKNKAVRDVVSNGDNLKLQNKNVSLDFIFDNTKRMYYDSNKNSNSRSFYKLELRINSWKHYEISLQKFESVLINNIIVEVINNDETFYIQHIDDTPIDKNIKTIDSTIIDINTYNKFVKDKKTSINSGFKKFKNIKNEIDSYSWIVTTEKTSKILKKESDYNNIINSIIGKQYELDLQLYQLSLFKLKFEMNKNKRLFFTGYNIIESNSNEITNPYDKKQFVTIENNILTYNNLHDLIIKSYGVDKNLSFQLMNIKSYTNGDIYNNIYNYYTILESRIYINNDKEIEECKTLYKKVISTKDKIINDKKNNIEKEKVNIQRQVDTLMKQLDIKNNSGEIIKKDINNNINKINQLLNEVTINDLKDISSSIINIENNIRNTIGNNEKQKLLIELINKEDMLVSKSKKADENYDVMIELNDNSREKLNIYDSLINELLSERAIITRNLANIFNLLDINTEMQKISEIILKLGNTKFDLQNKITLTAQIISNYNDELSKY